MPMGEATHSTGFQKKVPTQAAIFMVNSTLARTLSKEVGFQLNG